VCRHASIYNNAVEDAHENMGTCSNCGTTILFGGVREGRLHFCGQSCRQQQTPFIEAIRNVPDDLVARQTQEIHHGTCPQCFGPGPVDLFTSYRIWSAVVLTSWNEIPALSCHRCGVNAKLSAIFFSGVLGWWGIPWGVVFTPVQLFRNFTGLFSRSTLERPSDELAGFVRTLLAAQSLQSEEVYLAETVNEQHDYSSPHRPRPR
jgi:hypothetical protein